ncbi:hypothetical protein WA158_006527 [Blastocystis sp. Blastoise]
MSIDIAEHHTDSNNFRPFQHIIQYIYIECSTSAYFSLLVELFFSSLYSYSIIIHKRIPFLQNIMIQFPRESSLFLQDPTSIAETVWNYGLYDAHLWSPLIDIDESPATPATARQSPSFDTKIDIPHLQQSLWILKGGTDGMWIRPYSIPKRNGLKKFIFWYISGPSPALLWLPASSFPGISFPDIPTDLAAVARKPRENKDVWFKEAVESIHNPHKIRIILNRRNIYVDSLLAFATLSAGDLRKTIKLQFTGEPGVDAGGVTREWIYLLIREIFTGKIYSQPIFNYTCRGYLSPPNIKETDELSNIYIFMGKLIGRAIFEEIPIGLQFHPLIYKSILSLPIGLEDLYLFNQTYLNSYRYTLESQEEELKDLNIYFTYRDDPTYYTIAPLSTSPVPIKLDTGLNPSDPQYKELLDLRTMEKNTIQVETIEATDDHEFNNNNIHVNNTDRECVSVSPITPVSFPPIKRHSSDASSPHSISAMIPQLDPSSVNDRDASQRDCRIETDEEKEKNSIHNRGNNRGNSVRNDAVEDMSVKNPSTIPPAVEINSLMEGNVPTNRHSSIDKDIKELTQYYDDIRGEVSIDVEGQHFHSYENNRGDKRYSDDIEHELIEGGRDIQVSVENRDMYILYMLRHMYFERYSYFIGCFLHGLFTVIPREFFMIYTEEELKLKVEGELSIDVNDWREHTVYAGIFSSYHPSVIVSSFWHILETLPTVLLSRLLRFSTGYIVPPPGGFQSLKGPEGRYIPFCLSSLPEQQYFRNPDKNHLFIRSHTCFHKLEIPICSESSLRCILIGLLENEEALFGFDEE